MKPVILWDIDGTILSTGGAGRGALDEAFEALYGVPNAFKQVHFGGRTDPGIVAQAFALAGLPCDETRIAAVKEAYLPRLVQRLHERRAEMRVHPAMPGILNDTAPLAVNALLTGNWRDGARHKLGAIGLWERFAFGAFGDDSAIRNELVPIARTRFEAPSVPVVVIGDTLADVACARAGDAVAVAVCTGWAPRGDLLAAKPDLLLEDLEQGRDALLELLRGLG